MTWLRFRHYFDQRSKLEHTKRCVHERNTSMTDGPVSPVQAGKKIVLRSAQDVTELINSGRLRTGKSFAITLIALGGIFLDAYDFTSVAFGMPYIAKDFNLTPAMLAVVSASIMVGALRGIRLRRILC